MIIETPAGKFRSGCERQKLGNKHRLLNTFAQGPGNKSSCRAVSHDGIMLVRGQTYAVVQGFKFSSKFLKAHTL